MLIVIKTKTMFNFKKTSKYKNYIGTSFVFKGDSSTTIYTITALNGDKFMLNDGCLFLPISSFLEDLKNGEVLIFR